MVDFTYVDNVVHGHILAEEHLGEGCIANGQVGGGRLIISVRYSMK